MNYRMIFYTLGKILIVLAVLMAAPLVCSLCYQEWVSVGTFAIVACGCGLIGCAVTLLIKPKTQVFFAKEGLIIVSLAWILISAIGALPFVISGDIPNYVDAFFEMVSGFTTTGATILRNVEALSKGMLFWRSLSHWIGGMGVLVFLYALFTNAPSRSMHVLRAEMPGPIVDKIVPRTKDTAKILYVIYFVMTLLLVVLLWFSQDMDLYESLVHAFGAAGTGGFGVKADGITSYSPYCQWVIAIFMLLFGLNFNVYFLVLVGRGRSLLKSDELWTYLGIVVAAIVLVGVGISDMGYGIEEIIRLSTFQVSSIMTTTGYAVVDFNTWPALAKTVLLILMLVGGCAGSTAGGFKVSRVCILFKKVGNDLKKVLHPRTTSVVKFEGKVLDRETTSSVTTYLGVYVLLAVTVMLLLGFDSQIQAACAGANASVVETNISATISCLNNVGPAFGVAGPMGSYADYSAFSKIILSITMLFGRLEIYPLLLTLTPTTWLKR